MFGHVRTAQKGQQGAHRRGRGAELRGGGFVAVERDVRHAELIPHRRPVFGDVTADHGDLPAPHALPHQVPDDRRRAAGFLFPAGRSKQVHFRGSFQRLTAAGLQQLGHCCKAGSICVPPVPAQKFRCGRFTAVFAGQLPQLHGHLLGSGKQAGIPRHQWGTVVAQGHRHGGQRRQQGPQQPLFRRVEGIEFVNEQFPVLQKLRQAAPGQGRFQPVRRQFQPIGRVHAGARQQGLIALQDQRQFGQLAALGAAVLGQVCQLFAGQARALQLVDGLRCHLAEGRTAPVAVVVVHLVLQFFQCPAHQHRPACVRKGLHRAAALGGQDVFGQAGEGKALHHAGQGIPQFPVDAALGAGGELLRHQQDAALSGLGPGLDAGVQQGGLAAAGTAQNQFEHDGFLPFLDFTDIVPRNPGQNHRFSLQDGPGYGILCQTTHHRKDIA